MYRLLLPNEIGICIKLRVIHKIPLLQVHHLFAMIF